MTAWKRWYAAHPSQRVRGAVWLGAAAIGIVIWIAILSVTGLTRSAPHGGDASGSAGSSSASPWTGAAQRLGNYSTDYQIAKAGGDALKMQRVEVEIVASCQADAQQLAPDANTGHSQVQQLCAIIGVSVP